MKASLAFTAAAIGRTAWVRRWCWSWCWSWCWRCSPALCFSFAPGEYHVLVVAGAFLFHVRCVISQSVASFITAYGESWIDGIAESTANALQSLPDQYSEVTSDRGLTGCAITAISEAFWPTITIVDLIIPPFHNIRGTCGTMGIPSQILSSGTCWRCKIIRIRMFHVCHWSNVLFSIGSDIIIPYNRVNTMHATVLVGLLKEFVLLCCSDSAHGDSDSLNCCSHLLHLLLPRQVVAQEANRKTRPCFPYHLSVVKVQQ